MSVFKNRILYFFQLLVIASNYLFNKDFNERKVIQQYVKNNGHIFDVGSNIGSYTKFVSQSLKDKNLHIHTFEPSSKSCDFQKKLKIPRIHKLFINNLAVLDGKVRPLTHHNLVGGLCVAGAGHRGECHDQRQKNGNYLHACFLNARSGLRRMSINCRIS